MIPRDILLEEMKLPNVLLGTWDAKKAAELTQFPQYFIRSESSGIPFVLSRATRTKLGKTEIAFDIDIRPTKAKCGHEACGISWVYGTSQVSIEKCKAELFKSKAFALSESPDAEYRIVDNATFEVVESKRFADLNAE